MKSAKETIRSDKEVSALPNIPQSSNLVKGEVSDFDVVINLVNGWFIMLMTVAPWWKPKWMSPAALKIWDPEELG